MNEPQPQNSKSAPEPTEAEYLAAQAHDAAAAIGAAFSSFKTDLSQGLDPKGLAKQHPWIAIGAAAVAGFAAASTLVPSKEEQALKKLSRIEQALRPEPFSAPPRPAPAEQTGEPQSLKGRVFAEILAALKPALSSALAAYAATRPAPDPQPTNGNGHSSYPQPETNPNPS
jgi:hypothetical protein